MSEQPPTTPQSDDVGEFEDFDAWREQQAAQRGPGKRIKVFGKVVALPTSLPLGLQMSLDDMVDKDDVRNAVGRLYGKGALDHWIDEDVSTDEFRVLVAYGVAYAGGARNITFDEAAEKIREAEAKAAKQGKAPGPAPKKKPKQRSGKR